MVFSEDLMAVTRLLYQYTELVFSRNTTRVGIIHDMRIANFANASQKLQSALYGLKKHFHTDLHAPIESVHRMASYLHTSFLGAMNYRRPYGPANPFGITVDMECKMIDDEINRDEVVIGVFRMVTMGMLLVHHFVLEHMMWMCAVNDELDRRLLTNTEMTKFREMMVDLRDYMESKYADGYARFEIGHADYPCNISNFVDITYTESKILDAFDKATRGFIPLVIREFFYTFIMHSLSHYNEKLPDDLDIIKKTDSRDFFSFKVSHSIFFEILRYVEDSNPREKLFDVFKSKTANPVYYYATTVSYEDGDNDHIVIQEHGSEFNVAPRRQVHVWRNLPDWNQQRFHQGLALVHGEVSIMTDLMFNMAPLVVANRDYRMTDRIESAHIHLMMTRMDGPFETYYRFTDKLTEVFRKSTGATSDKLRSIRDPVIPYAVVVQPMPEELKAWTKSTVEQFDKDVNYASMLTNGVLHRSKSINLNDTVRKSRKNPHTTNLVLNLRNYFPELQWSVNRFYGINTVFYLHYGRAVSLLPLIKENKVYKSETLSVASGEYGKTRAEAFIGLDTTNTNPYVYERLSKVQDQLCEKLKEVVNAVQDAPAPFIHPMSWITDVDRKDKSKGWVKCDQSFDMHKGTYVTFSPALGEAGYVANIDDQHAHAAVDQMKTKRDEAAYDATHQHASYVPPSSYPP